MVVSSNHNTDTNNVVPGPHRNPSDAPMKETFHKTLVHVSGKWHTWKFLDSEVDTCLSQPSMNFAALMAKERIKRAMCPVPSGNDVKAEQANRNPRRTRPGTDVNGGSRNGQKKNNGRMSQLE
ncbi:hypothetical protein O3P69_018410 [Scylla paramamosain]|uniref:Uncharacterized protein n=1 Tax=Scylla paramamosain TaxID=85552 RepID=A0AAW0T237_SCYPA